jgi:hypothetical protein
MDFNPKNFIVIVLSVTFLLAVSTIWSFWHFGSINIPGITQNQATSTDTTTATTTKTACCEKPFATEGLTYCSNCGGDGRGIDKTY